MKKIFLIATIVLTISACFVSCSDGIEDFNVNPNEAEVVPTSGIFNRATRQYTDVMRSSFNSGRLVLNWVEYWGQTAYADEDRYLYRETSAEGIYNGLYLTASEFKSIIDLNVDPATSTAAAASGNNNNQIAASRIMLAMCFHNLADTFGDVPYYSYGSDDPDFQALSINSDGILSPVFATQEKIYVDILKELREAADMLVTGEPVFTAGDNVFGGDASKWKKFANSLSLRVANRLKGVNAGAANSAISAALSSGVMTSNADNAVQAYGPTDDESSPWWSAYISRTDFAVASPFVDLLKATTGDFLQDPRLFQMAAPKSVGINDIKADDYVVSTNYDDYQGIPYGFSALNAINADSFSYPPSTILTPTYGEVLMEYAEVAFIQSELNNWNQGQYEAGVRASMEKWGVSSGEINTFVGGLPTATAENVLTQKYVALYMQAHEAYAEYRRTGYPDTSVLLLPGETYNLPADQQPGGTTSYVFVPAVNAQDLPFRLAYPATLQSLNPTNRAAAVSGLSNGDTILSKLFWDVN